MREVGREVPDSRPAMSTARRDPACGGAAIPAESVTAGRPTVAHPGGHVVITRGGGGRVKGGRRPVRRTAQRP
jgi:hypothetical protein